MIITILHIIITTISILNLSLKTIAPKILAHTKCINKYWKYTQIFAATKSSKIIGVSWKFRRNPKILALQENSGGIPKYWRFMKIQVESQNIGASWKFRRNPKILVLHENSGGFPKVRRKSLAEFCPTQYTLELRRTLKSPRLMKNLCACQKIRRPSKS